MSDWLSTIPEYDREIYRRAGFGRKTAWKGSASLVIVDALWAFIGHERVDVFDAIEEYPTACGKAGWDGLAGIVKALSTFGEAGLPVIHVCADGRSRPIYGATTRTSKEVSSDDKEAYAIPKVIAPLPGEPIVYKTKASAFFRTPLDVLLHKAGVGAVFLAGCTTSGCIRASAVDAHSLGFETVLLEDAIWDRSDFSHAVSMFEMSMKYASVASVAEVSRHLSM